MLKKKFSISKFTEEAKPTPLPKLFLRHDIDYSLEAALILANAEAKKGIFSTYFLILESSFYNPFERNNYKAIRAIQKLGHSIGLHFVTEATQKQEIEQDIELKFAILREIVPAEPVVSFHFAKQEVYHSYIKFDKFLNAYGPRFFSEGAKYLSDSNQIWREGCPCEKKFEKEKDLQLNTHPIWWVYDTHDPHKILNRLLKEEVEKRKKIMQSALPGSVF